VAFSNTTTGSVTSWLWDFGDSTTSSVQSPTHIYNAAGNYTVVLTATGPGGTVSKTASTPISVGTPQHRSVSFNGSPTIGSAPLNVMFTNSTTGQVTTWAWNFGDGTTSNLKSPAHTLQLARQLLGRVDCDGPRRHRYQDRFFGDYSEQHTLRHQSWTSAQV
jgi:PKD repeat protein